MTATITAPSASTHTQEATTAAPSLWKPGLRSGVVAAVATMVVAGVASGIDISLAVDGEAIPVLGFGQTTLMATVVGILLARSLRRRVSQPRPTFVRTTVALTALSLVPDVIAPADTATKLTLMLTHLVAAAIIIPALASRLPERRAR